jgi:hypothetical protein
MVRINEIVLGATIALGRFELRFCPSFDINGNSRVDVNELIQSVRAALFRCVPIPTPTSTSPPSATETPTATATPTPTASPTHTSTLTPTATVACPPLVTPFNLSFNTPGDLSAEDQKIPNLGTTLHAFDQRQRHYVQVSLIACHDDLPGSVTFTIVSPALPDRTATVEIDSQCGALSEVAVAFLYEGLPPGDYPISVFVSGVGSYTSSRLEVDQPPPVRLLRRDLSSTHSLGAGVTELEELSATVDVDQFCTTLRVDVTMIAASMAAGLTYDLRLSTDIAEGFVLGAETGQLDSPLVTTLESVYENLPLGPHTFSVTVDQHGSGPGLYLPGSSLEVSRR